MCVADRLSCVAHCLRRLTYCSLHPHNLAREMSLSSIRGRGDGAQRGYLAGWHTWFRRDAAEVGIFFLLNWEVHDLLTIWGQRR